MADDSERQRAKERREIARQRRQERGSSKKKRARTKRAEPMPPAVEPAEQDADATPRTADETPPSVDPYVPPRTEEPTPRRSQEQEPLRQFDASTGQRLGNFLIDLLVTIVLSVVLGVVVALMGMAYVLLDSVLSYVFGYSVYAGYYLVAEGMFGRTIGKLLTGTKVVTVDGETPTFGAILQRSLIRLIPFEPFSYLGPEPTGWHDRWSKTRVVRLRP